MDESILGKMTNNLPEIVSQAAASLISAISDPVLLCDTGGKVVAINRAATSYFTHTDCKTGPEVVGLTVYQLFPNNDDNLTRTLKLCRSQTGIFPGKILLKRDISGNEEPTHQLFQGAMVRLIGNRPTHILIRLLPANSVSKRRFQELNAALQKKNKQLLRQRELSRKDAHTGLWQRSTLFEELPGYIDLITKHNKPCSFAIIDLDDFKGINDRYGHPCGDEVLTCMGQLLLKACRSLDRVARIGGEEFALIMPDTGLEAAFHACQRLNQQIRSSTVVYNGETIKITASFGVTELSNEDTAMEAYKRADGALYAAKEAGRDRCARIQRGSETSFIEPDRR